MNELTSAEAALAAVAPVVRNITGNEENLATPCPGFDVAALADHLVRTIALVGLAADASFVASSDGPIETLVMQTAAAAIQSWRARGAAGAVVFGDRVMPAGLALGVLSLELVVHGWDLASALGRHVQITALHADFVVGLARQIITPTSRRAAGFDEPVPVDTGAGALDRLIAFTGRAPLSSAHLVRTPAGSVSHGAKDHRQSYD
jgi:uncharacterized protein (TIGR03086 family)